jgi:hypothetical protein
MQPAGYFVPVVPDDPDVPVSPLLWSKIAANATTPAAPRISLVPIDPCADFIASATLASLIG